MAHVAPRARHDLAQFEDTFRMHDATTGFVPNSLYTTERHPATLSTLTEPVRAGYSSGSLDRGLKALVALVARASASFRHGQAHTARRAEEFDVDPAQVEAVWDFERSPLYSEFERAALPMARDAARVPNAVTERHFERSPANLGDDEIAEIVAVVALFGFLNRWNDTMATDSEELPMTAAAARLGDRVRSRKHAATSSTKP